MGIIEEGRRERKIKGRERRKIYSSIRTTKNTSVLLRCAPMLKLQGIKNSVVEEISRK